MGNEQDILLERVKTFQFRWEESLCSRFYTFGPENFMLAEQIHVHYAAGEDKLEYVDIVDYWLNSLFNFLEDRFEDAGLEHYAAQCEWKAIDQEEISRVTDGLFLKFGLSKCFEFEPHPKQSFMMLQMEEVTAFLVETETRYASFHWHAATT